MLSLSCQNAPVTSFEGLQCEITLPAAVDIAGKLYLDADTTECWCRDYKVSAEMIGPINKFIKSELSECNLVTGYRPVAYAKLTNLMEWVRQNLPAQTTPVASRLIPEHH